MSDKRKPDGKIVAEYGGKKIVIEMFDERQFGIENRDYTSRPHFRLRINGKWLGAKGKGNGRDVYSRTEVLTELRRWFVRRGHKEQ